MRRRKHGQYQPTAVYEMAARIKARGIDLTQAVGPWRPIGRRPSRPGRVITNEHTQVVVDTSERAVDVAGLLNWCGVHDLNPVPELVPGVPESQEARMQQVRDPVCGTSVDRSDAERASNGVREFFFCSEACREAFRAEPGKYVDVEKHEPPFTATTRLAAPKFGSAGSGGLELEPGPERHTP
jgi:YHS domain-containing protein